MPKICDFETCRKFANYGESYCKPIRCREHKGEYKLVSQLCQEGNCCIKPIYNFEGEINAVFCIEHKKNEMVDIKHKSCEYQNCKIRPSFNYENKKNGIYCSIHKLANMIIVTNKKCEFEKCNKSSICNYEGETIMLYCAEHKLENMVNIKSKKCEYINCKRIPIYNFENEITPLFCSFHKDETMVNISSKRCEYPNCKIHPNYNYCGKKTGIFCSNHKLENMVDVKNKKCKYENCSRQPSFNYENEKTAIYCSFHKLENMLDIVNKKCKSSQFCLGTLGNPKYKGYCSSCYQQLFPTDPLSFQIHSKTKEIAVRDYINLIFEGFQHDKPLWTGNCDCTHRRRIDHRKLIGNTLLCIETDENQHKNYNDKDEEIRYDDLFMLHGGKFVYIRFNPDKFKDKNCKSVNPMLYTRLPVLKEEIEKQISRIEKEENIELLEIIKLYYDDYN
jgi:hypothetical protein